MRRTGADEAAKPKAARGSIPAAILGLAPGRLPPTILPPQPHPLPSLPPLWPPNPPRDYPRPEYAQRFQCIASACEDTCCKGWSVPVDQRTYEKFRSTQKLRQQLGRLVVLNHSSPGPADYARIPLTAQTECGFLEPDKLCGIQKEFGEEMLPSACATYPRAVSTNAGAIEKALNLSCPEAARVTLLDMNLLGYGPWVTPGPARYATVMRDRMGMDRTRPNGGGKRSFEPRLAVREFALLLLSDRRYPLWQRLYLLGNLARRLQALSEASGKAASLAKWCDANPLRVAKLLAESAHTAAQEGLRPAMDEIAIHQGQQIQLVLELLRARFAEPPVPMRFLECVRDFQLGLGTATATNEQQILDAYAESHQRYYRPLMERNPHLLENYLANLVFKNNYPFGREQQGGLPSHAPSPASDAESEHLALCMQAALVQTLLIGMAAHYREAFDSTHVVKLVQSLARTIEHSQRSIDQIAEFVRSHELNNPRGMALLLHQEA